MRQGIFSGRGASAASPVTDKDFRFHLATYLLHNLVFLLWVESGLASGMEGVDSLIRVAIPWASAF